MKSALPRIVRAFVLLLALSAIAPSELASFYERQFRTFVEETEPFLRLLDRCEREMSEIENGQPDRETPSCDQANLVLVNNIQPLIRSLLPVMQSFAREIVTFSDDSNRRSAFAKASAQSKRASDRVAILRVRLEQLREQTIHIRSLDEDER